jgi:formylmethanofuran dehydrogenase subunit C
LELEEGEAKAVEFVASKLKVDREKIKVSGAEVVANQIIVKGSVKSERGPGAPFEVKIDANEGKIIGWTAAEPEAGPKLRSR